jgi:hypothetical protein
MPFFKTTTNILVDHGEYFESKWMNSNKITLPPTTPWDYQREMSVEDVDIWEVIFENGPVAVYGAWAPYAEFYLVKLVDLNQNHQPKLETFYGPKASDKVAERLKQLGIVLPKTKLWVENDELWLH